MASSDSSDMKNFLNQFAAGTPGSAAPPRNGALGEVDSIPEDYDVNHLDYHWIEEVATIKDVKEIEDLLNVLRSGKEGYYPDLEQAFEARLISLNPSKRRQPAVPPPSFDEIKHIGKDIFSWVDDMKIKDKNLKSSAAPTTAFPAVRQSSLSSSAMVATAVENSGPAAIFTEIDGEATGTDTTQSPLRQQQKQSRMKIIEVEEDDSSTAVLEREQGNEDEEDLVNLLRSRRAAKSKTGKGASGRVQKEEKAQKQQQQQHSILKTISPHAGAETLAASPAAAITIISSDTSGSSTSTEDSEVSASISAVEDHGCKKHVRFRDQVEASLKAVEQRKKKEERRKHIAEVKAIKMAEAEAAEAAAKKRRRVKKRNTSTSAVNGGSAVALVREEGEGGANKIVAGTETETETESEMTAAALVSATEEEDEADNMSTPVVVADAVSTPIAAPSSVTVKSARIKSYDYRAWDRMDVDAEIKKLEEEEEMSKAIKKGEKSGVDAPSKSSTTRINTESSTKIPTKGFTVPSDPQEKAFLADVEKNKGNEAFKSGDFQEACDFYTRSLRILQRPSVLTNRAISYIKLKLFEKAEDDCTAALSFNDPSSNFKAYLRRGSARMKRGRHLAAMADFDAAISITPDSREAISLRQEAQRLHVATEGDLLKTPTSATQWQDEKKKTASRIKIVEVEEEDVEAEIVTPMVARSGSRVVHDASTRRADHKQNQQTQQRSDVSSLSQSAKTQRDPVGIELAQNAKSDTAAKACVVPKEVELTVVDVDEDDSDDDSEIEGENVVVSETTIENIVDKSGTEGKMAETSKAVNETEKAVRLSCDGSVAENLRDSAIGMVTEVVTTPVAEKIDSPAQTEQIAQAVVMPTPIALEKKAIRPAAGTSFEFENVWRATKSDQIEWSEFIQAHPAERLVTLLSNVVNPSVLPDVFKALNNIAATKDIEKVIHVVKVLTELKRLPRLSLLVGFFTRKDKVELKNLLSSLSVHSAATELSAFFSKLM